jgi:hypothetical protein
MYTPMPVDYHQKPFGNLPSGANSVKIQVPNIQRDFAPQGYQNIPTQGMGGYVYTRRIIDPNNNNVIA